MKERNWFFFDVEKGKSIGPFPESKFKDMISQGEFGGNPHVWTDGFDGARALKDEAWPKITLM